MRTDHQLKQDVTSELGWEPSVNEAHIGVSVKNGIVTLSGHVPTYGEKFGMKHSARRGPLPVWTVSRTTSSSPRDPARRR